MVRCSFSPRSAAEAEVGCPLDHCMCGTHDVSHECEESPRDTGCPTHGHTHIKCHRGYVGETIMVCEADGCDWSWEDGEEALRLCE